VAVEAGDWVVGDVDGVVIVPGGQIEAVLTAARARTAKEQGYFEALRNGATTVDLLGLDAAAVTVDPTLD
jgi:4-hydroxy-4-methyl-2-oxoglutarate aldolase